MVTMSVCTYVPVAPTSFLYCRYYKRFSIPDMQRCDLALEQEALTVAHANNTLIITVSQPPTWTVYHPNLYIDGTTVLSHSGN